MFFETTRYTGGRVVCVLIHVVRDREQRQYCKYSDLVQAFHDYVENFGSQ